MIDPVGRHSLQSFMSCWVCQECKILTTLYQAISQVVLAGRNFENEVKSPSRTKSSLAPQQQPFVCTGPVRTILYPLHGTWWQGEVKQSCCLLYHEQKSPSSPTEQCCIFYQHPWNSNRLLTSKVKSNPRLNQLASWQFRPLQSNTWHLNYWVIKPCLPFPFLSILKQT